MDGLQHRVRDVIETRGGGIREVGKGPGYLLRSKWGAVLVACEAEEGGWWGFRWEKVIKECFCYLELVGASRQVREPLWRRPNTNLLAVQRECGVADANKSDQCIFLAEAIALKYVLLEHFTLLELWGSGRGGISLQTYDIPVSGRRGEGTTMASSGATAVYPEHGR